MRKVKELTNRIAAMFLSGLLVVGAVPGTVLASEFPADTGQTSETAAEDMEDTLSEEMSTEELGEDTALQGEEAAEQYYTVTLDANGGYFENEWDDAIGEIVEQAEVISKQISVGGTVAASPVFTNLDGQSMVFAGWSLERDGELVSQAEEEYTPLDNCVLYAVWDAEDSSVGDIESQEIAEENTDQIDASQDFGEVDEAAEGSQDVGDSEAVEGSQNNHDYNQDSDEVEAAEESETDQDARNNGTAEESFADENQAADADEDAEKASEESSGAIVSDGDAQTELIGSSEEEETVQEDGAMAAEGSGTCGENLTWTLEEGILTISGTGAMYDYELSTRPYEENTISTVIIEDGVTSIGNYAFSCFSLTSIDIPNSVTSIGDDAFFGCDSLPSITIPDSVTSIGDGAFGQCKSMRSITIPDSVTSIGDGAFTQCESLGSITISEKITSISSGMFLSCSSLTSIDIPDSVTSIGNYAFEHCSNLRSITIPKGVTDIGDYVFAGCSSLENIFVEEGNQNYSSKDGVLFNSDQTVLVYYPGGGEEVYTIPDSVTSIGNTAFDDCSNLTSITIPDTVTSIGEKAFFSCWGLTDITIPENVTSIGSSAFEACGNLESITIPDSVTSIGQNAFKGCVGLVIYCYSGSKALEYAKNNKIAYKIFMSGAFVMIPDQSYTYTGSPQEPEVTVILNETQLTKGTDYEVAYSNNIKVGTAAVTVNGINEYSGIKKLTFTIVKALQPIKASNLSLTYPNSGKITVSGNKGSLTYKSSNTAVATVDSTGKVKAKSGGTAKITITAAATSQYNAASKTITVNVAKAAQSITAKASAPVVFAGQTTTVSVTGAKGTRSFKSSDTTIATVDKSTGKVTAKKAGTVKITAASAATAQYNAASKTVTIKVLPALISSLKATNQVTGIKLTWKKISGATGYKIYRNSTLIKTINDGGTTTYKDTKANTNMKKYVYKVVAKGPAGDSPLARTVIAIRVDRPALTSVTNSASSVMTVKWTKTARAIGYQIRYSTSKTFASDNGTDSASGGKDSKRIEKLKRGKTYYVRVRAYKIVGNRLYWSEWSPVKTVRISK